MHRSSKSEEQQLLPDDSPGKTHSPPHSLRGLSSALTRLLHCRPLQAYHTSFFFGSLRMFEILAMTSLAVLILLRVYDHIRHNHFGRAGRCTEYTLVVCAMLSLRNNPVSRYFPLNWEKLIVSRRT